MSPQHKRQCSKLFAQVPVTTGISTASLDITSIARDVVETLRFSYHMRGEMHE